MAKIKHNQRIQQFAKINNISDEEAKKQLEDQGEYYDEEEQLSDIQNAVDDRDGSLSALQTQADMMKQGVGLGAGLTQSTITQNEEKYELKDINLSISKHNDKSTFSYKLSGNTLTITAKNCTINIIEVTNDNLKVVFKGEYLTINSNATVKSIENNSDNTIINGSSKDDDITNKGKNVIIHAGSGKDEITNKGKEAVIFAGDGNDSVTNTGDNSIIDAGLGDDNITNKGKYSEVIGSEGNDTITNQGLYSKIYGNEGNDTITNKGTYSQIYGNQGSDTIKNTAGSTQIYGNTQSDTITNTSNSASVIDAEDEDVINNKGFSCKGYQAIEATYARLLATIQDGLPTSIANLKYLDGGSVRDNLICCFDYHQALLSPNAHKVVYEYAYITDASYLLSILNNTNISPVGISIFGINSNYGHAMSFVKIIGEGENACILVNNSQTSTGMTQIFLLSDLLKKCYITVTAINVPR